MSIQNHTVTHQKLTECDTQTKEYEILHSKLEVARICGREPLVMCFPNGKYDEEVLSLLEGNYRFGIAVRDDTYITGDDPFQIPRYGIYRGITMEEFIGILNSVEYPQAG